MPMGHSYPLLGEPISTPGVLNMTQPAHNNLAAAAKLDTVKQNVKQLLW